VIGIIPVISIVL